MTPNTTAAVAWGLIELKHSDIYEHAARLAEAKRKIRQELAVHGLRLVDGGWDWYRLEGLRAAEGWDDRTYGTLVQCCREAMLIIDGRNTGKDAA